MPRLTTITQGTANPYPFAKLRPGTFFSVSAAEGESTVHVRYLVGIRAKRFMEMNPGTRIQLVATSTGCRAHRLAANAPVLPDPRMDPSSYRFQLDAETIPAPADQLKKTPDGRTSRAPTYPWATTPINGSFLVPCRPENADVIRKRLRLSRDQFTRLRAPDSRFELDIEQGGVRVTRVENKEMLRRA